MKINFTTRSNSVIIVTFMLMLVCLQLLASATAYASTGRTPTVEKQMTWGLSAAKEISQTTGMAMNPLLCISVFGAYTYFFEVPPELRSFVPWHLSPYFWGPLTGLMIFVFLKDASKIILPKIISIPLDAFENLIEKNASAIIAIPVLISGVINGDYKQIESVIHSVSNFLLPVAIASEVVTTSTTGGGGGSVFMIAMTIISVLLVYVVVWVTSQAFNVLMLLCPFSTIDTMLAGFKSTIVVIIMFFAKSDYIVALSIGIIVLSIYLFPKALRLVAFGSVMSYDILKYKVILDSIPNAHSKNQIKCFTSCYFSKIPPITYGTIHIVENFIHFTYRKMYFFKKIAINTGIKSSECVLVRGIVSPVVNKKHIAEEEDDVQILRIRAMYCQDYDSIAAFLSMPQGDATNIYGLVRNGLRWWRSIFNKPPTFDIEQNYKAS